MFQGRAHFIGILFVPACLCVLLAGDPVAAADRATTGGTTAQEGGPVIMTQEVVVSATKTEQPVSHVTSSVEVITGEDLKRRKIKTVVDALRLSQGLAVFSNGGPGTTATVRIRGGSPNQTLVLIDGAIMNSATTGQFDFANLTTDNIERIEILRGSQSMLWGSDAMGGVINIVTKKGKGKPRVTSFAEYGSFVSLREGTSASGETGPADFAVSLSRWDMAGFSAVDFRRGAIERDAYRNWQASGRLGFRLPGEGRLDLDFRWLNGDVDFDNASAFGGGPFDVFKLKSTSNQFVYSGRYEQPLADWYTHTLTMARAQESLVTQAGTFQRSVVTGAVSPASTFNNSQINTLSNRIESRHDVTIAEPLLLTLGYQFREQQGENISSSAIPETIISSQSGFAQLQLNAWDRLFATAGLRQDAFNIFGDATTYRVTGGYLFEETGTKVRGSYSTGFRAPAINEILFPNFGNPNLRPEKSQSMDAAVDQSFFGDRLRLSATYFWNRFRDLITSAPSATVCGVGPFGTNFCAQNIGAAKSQGWELGLDATLLQDLPFMRSLELRGQYTYTLTRDLEENAGNRLPRWPVDQWSGILSYQPIEAVRVNLAVRYVGSRFNDVANTENLKAFDVWTLSAFYDVSSHVQVYTRAENLFNEKYEEILFLGTPVRSIYFGVKTDFTLS